jgi:malonyl CoA-acyl carrier protein transacylase/acyl carrier protein
MGKELVMNFPSMRRLYARMDSLLVKDNFPALSEIVFPRPVFTEAEKNTQAALLQRTEYSQPAIGMFSAGLYKILQQAGFKADFTAGHSFGELTALWAAGVFSDEDYCYLVKARGQAMAAPQDPSYDPGTMLAVKEDHHKVEAVLKHFPQVSIANLNSPRQVVLAGPSAEIERVRSALQQQGYAAVLLPVAAAFHTPLIAFAQKSFAIASKSVTFHNPQIPVYTNVTGSLYPKEPTAIQKILETHLSKSVLFKQEIENIYNAGGYCFIEFGPKRILTNLVKDILGERPHLAVALNPSSQKDCDRSLREAVIQLRVAGLQLKNIDPYQLVSSIPPTSQNKNLSIRLNGINYVSEKTKNAFNQNLQDGHQVELNKGASITTQQQIPTPQVTSSNGHHKQETEQEVIKLTHPTPPSTPDSSTPHTPHPAPHTLPMLDYQKILESIQYILAQFQQNQSENLQVHGTYLNHQMEYTKTFFHLMQQQNAILADSKSSQETAHLKSVLMEGLERSMMQFHAQQGDTLRVHETYLQEQVEYTKNFFHLIQQEYSQLIPTQSNGKNSSITVASHNNIDVEITEPSIEPVVNSLTIPEVILPTPESWDIPEPVVPTVNTVIEPVIPTVSIEAEPVIHEIVPINTTSVTIDIVDLGKNLLAIISEKTGYPSEMLEVDMDMEADLGIDSIKRVEILGALQDVYPDLPKPNVEELAEKRTIGQIIEYLESQISPNVSVEIAQTEVKTDIVQEAIAYGGSTTIAEPVKTEVDIQQLIIQTEASASIDIQQPIVEPELAPINSDFNDLAQTLLSITSEKTGYPVEMLELDMDMEADLGIDSIKRVEILGGMQDTYPDMPKPDVEELGELRTIGQIVDYLQGLVGGEKKKYQSDDLNQPISVEHNIGRHPVQLKNLPRPDHLDFRLPEGHICLITDDGSLTTTKLAHCLLTKGWKVVVLSLPSFIVPQKALLPTGAERIKLIDLTEEHLQQQLANITLNHGKIGGFIHLNPIFEAQMNGKITYQEPEKELLKHIFLLAKYLKKSLNEAAQLGHTCFCTVTRLDGALGLGKDIHFGPISGGLFGLTKVLNWEWQRVYCRAIDLHPTIDAEQSAHHILAELHDPNLYVTEVGYGSEGRVTLVAV